MAALYRAGRSWQALQVFKELRDRLVEELGLEPSGRLQRLHHAVLASDPGLDVEAARKPTLDLFAA
jgi:DNA-binding SARP family transcriptional activator